MDQALKFQKPVGPVGIGAFENMRIVELPGKNPPAHLKNEYAAAYALWHQVWQDTFLELNGTERLFSDDFTRQDDVLCLFEGDKCLLLIFFRNADITDKSTRNDSYFKVWPEETLSALGRDSNQTVIFSYITVAKEARGNYKGLALKRFIVALGVQYFLTSSATSMTATSRNGKGVNSVVSDYGATLMNPNFTLHGVPVDIAIFYKPELANLKTEWHEPMNHLWERRETHRYNREKILNFPPLKAA